MTLPVGVPTSWRVVQPDIAAAATSDAATIMGARPLL